MTLGAISSISVWEEVRPCLSLISFHTGKVFPEERRGRSPWTGGSGSGRALGRSLEQGQGCRRNCKNGGVCLRRRNR